MKTLVALFLLATVLVRPALAQSDAGAVRQELLRLLNAERVQAGAPPLRLDGALTRAAQEHAEEVSRRGSLQSGSSEDMQRRLTQAGYQAHEWTESLSYSSAGPEAALSAWKTRNPSSFHSLLDPGYRDLGVGVALLDGDPLYSLLFAVPEEDYFRRQTTGLQDLDKVRREMLAQVNAARQQAGLRPVRDNSRLDTAAQGHAEDMLARGYFDHRSPAGTTVRERSEAAGYAWRAIGENIAFGQTSVDEVVATWLDSPGHRRNILSPDFTELGLGLALGQGKDGKYQVYWVQSFGAPRS